MDKCNISVDFNYLTAFIGTSLGNESHTIRKPLKSSFQQKKRHSKILSMERVMAI